MALTADPALVTTSTDAEAPPIPRQVWLAFIVVLVASVMDLLDSTIAQTAAPAIREGLGGSYATIEWTTAAYTLAMATSLLLGGRLGDVFGRRQMLLAGMTAFIVASVLCAAAQSPGMLIGSRALQGLTAAVMVPQCFGLIRELFGDDGQQRAFAIFGPFMGLAAVVGPLIGGGIVDLDLLGSGWRGIFLVNVPVGLAALWLGWRVLPRTAPVTPGGRLDLPSVLLAMAGGFAIVYPLVEGRELDWPLWCIAMPFGGALLLLAFLRLQTARVARGATPLLEPSILHRAQYVSGLALVVCFIGAMGGMILALNVMFQNGLGFSPLGAGVATVAIPLMAIAGSIASAITIERLGRITIWIGSTVMALGLVGAVLTLHSQGGAISAWQLAPALTVTGFGMGMIFMPMFDVILAGVEPQQIGSASGLLESVQAMAMSLGIAIVGTVVFSAIGDRPTPDDFVSATEQGLLVCVALLVGAALTVGRLPRHARAEG